MTADRESDPSRARRQRRRPLGWAILLAAILVFGAASASRQIALGSDAARLSIARQIEDLTGLPVVLADGTAAFRLLPMPRLTLETVEIGSPDKGPHLSVARLTADLSLWAALLGRTEIERLVLAAPRLAAPPGTAPGASMPATFAPFLSRLHGLGDVEIQNGELTRGDDGKAIVSAANLNLSWPGGGSAASLSGTYSWNGQPVRLALRLAAPLAWLDGRTSSVDFDLTSPQLDLAFDGEAAASGRLSGRIQADLPSLVRTLRWLAAPGIAVPELGPLSVAADLTSDGGRLDLANALVSIDGFTGRGALDLDVPDKGPPRLGGTLAFERLDLDGIANGLAPAPRTPFETTRPISVGFVSKLDVDLRVSASEGRIGTLALNDLAGTVKMKDGTATLDIGDAGLLGGNGQMRVSVDTAASPPRLSGSASFRGVDAAGLLAAFGALPNAISGRADLSVFAKAPVTSWAGIADRHSLEASFSARSGSLAGLDPGKLRIGDSQLFDASASGSTLPFDTLKAEIASRGARMALISLDVAGEAGTVKAAGLLVGTESEADLEGIFEPAAPGTAGDALTKPKPMTLRMRGPWPHPVIAASASSADE